MNRALLPVLACAIVATTLSVVAAAGPPLTGGTGTIYFTSYGRQLVGIDEATERVVAKVPLKTGLAWTLRLSRDAARFYVESGDLEHFEVIDLAARQTVDTFTLGSADTHVRTLAFDVDPQQRFMVLVTRTAKKLIDRFEIGDPMIIQYDLRAHEVTRTIPWTTDPEPRYYGLNLRFSPDGRLLYVFGEKVLVYDAGSLEQIDSWDLSLPPESGLGRLNRGSMDESFDEPGFFTSLFTTSDPIEHRRQLVVGRVDLVHRRVDSFPIGPAPDHRDVSFALGGDRKFAYVLLEDIRQYELWTIDLATRRRQSRAEFESHPRVLARSSTNGKILYLFEAGNTIDVYEAAGFKHLRTIMLDGDMMYNTFHVVPQRP